MEKICRYCGIKFSPKHYNTMYCSKECKNKRGARPDAEPRDCEYCGETYVPNKNKKAVQRCCSKKCSRMFFYHNRRGDIHYCKSCGKEFFPKSKERTSFCSRECYFESIKKEPREKALPTCNICGNKFEGRANSKWCSDDCRKENARRKHHVMVRSKYDVPTYKCKECGIEFSPKYGEKRRNYCSYECLKRTTSRICKATRRARIRGAVVEGRVDPLRILERDGWRCLKCGVKTPKKLRGTTKDNAPEVDHLVPLALGGEHKETNLQCLCRKCNQEKGATAWGQMRLC